MILGLDLKPTTLWPNGYEEGTHNLIDSKVFGFDLETKGLSPYDPNVYIISFALSPEEKKANCCIMQHGNTLAQPYDLMSLVRILTNKDVILVGHNVKYDINWIRVKMGIDVKCMLFDTLYAQYLCNENLPDNSLGTISSGFQDLQGYKDLVDRGNLELAAKQDVLIYNGRDADACRRLFPMYGKVLKEQGMLRLMQTAMGVLPVLSKMETTGVWIDKKFAANTQKQLFDDMVATKFMLKEVAGVGFNPGSSNNLKHYLYTKLKLPIRKYTKTGEPAVDKEALELALLDTQYVEDITFIRGCLKWSKLTKLLSTYYDPIEKWTAYDGRVHTTYSMGKQRSIGGDGGTVTGRLGSNNPNLQNITRGSEHRGMFAATPGYSFFDGDFSQLELRVAAFLAQEPVMMKAFEEGQDIHTAVMSDMRNIPYNDMVQMLKDKSLPNYQELKNDRVAIKRINFGILYGVQAQRLQNLIWMELGIQWELDKCKYLIDDWLRKYQHIDKWIKLQHYTAISKGFVTMPLGQKRRLPEASFKTAEGRRALRQATNFPVQSFASWICLIGMMLLDEYFSDLTRQGINARLLLQVHDSLSGEIETKDPVLLEQIRQDVQRIMEQDTVLFIKDTFGVEFSVPLLFETSIGERWS